MAKKPRETKGYSEFKINSDQFNPNDLPAKTLKYFDGKNWVYEEKKIGDSRLAECYSFQAKKAERKGFRGKGKSNRKKFLKEIEDNDLDH
jgi:hypothetical protein